MRSQQNLDNLDNLDMSSCSADIETVETPPRQKTVTNSQESRIMKLQGVNIGGETFEIP